MIILFVFATLKVLHVHKVILQLRQLAVLSVGSFVMAFNAVDGSQEASAVARPRLMWLEAWKHGTARVFVWNILEVNAILDIWEVVECTSHLLVNGLVNSWIHVNFVAKMNLMRGQHRGWMLRKIRHFRVASSAWRLKTTCLYSCLITSCSQPHFFLFMTQWHLTVHVDSGWFQKLIISIVKWFTYLRSRSLNSKQIHLGSLVLFLLYFRERVFFDNFFDSVPKVHSILIEKDVVHFFLRAVFD